jgi:hypothetical protein
LTSIGGAGKTAAMPRTARFAPGGMLFHVLNRGVRRMRVFRAEKDYDAFLRVVEETLRVAPMRICAYCWLPNHWHFVLWPRHDGDLSHGAARSATPFGANRQPSNLGCNPRFIAAAARASAASKPPVLRMMLCPLPFSPILSPLLPRGFGAFAPRLRDL